MKKRLRSHLTDSHRIVVKVGTRVLVQRSGRPDLRRMAALADDLAALRKAGREVVLVSSGAVGAGMETLGLRSRPTRLPDLQMAAAVGQNRLMAVYDRLFSERGCHIGQVLLTRDDLKERTRHLNAANTMMNLLRHGIIPVVNENDVVAVDEIKFGDNDVLAALVALLIRADLLVILSTVNGLREPAAGGRTRRVSYLERVTDATRSLAGGKGSPLSIGGMASKLDAAEMVAATGAAAVIADGRRPGTVRAILAGQDLGTVIARAPEERTSLQGRKRWIAFFQRAQGTLVVDEGACDAVARKGRSLLPIGVRSVEGDFGKGALVNIQGPDGKVVARGLVDYPARDIRKILGKRTNEIANLLGSTDYSEVVHRDNMVPLDDR